MSGSAFSLLQYYSHTGKKVPPLTGPKETIGPSFRHDFLVSLLVQDYDNHQSLAVKLLTTRFFFRQLLNDNHDSEHMKS